MKSEGDKPALGIASELNTVPQAQCLATPGTPLVLLLLSFHPGSSVSWRNAVALISTEPGVSPGYISEYLKL